MFRIPLLRLSKTPFQMLWQTNSSVLFCALIALAFSSPRSSYGQVISFQDGTTTKGKLLELNAKQILFAPLPKLAEGGADNRPEKVPNDSMLRFGHPPQVRQLDSVVFNNGSMLACVVLTVSPQEIKIRSRLFELESIPTRLCRGIILREYAHPKTNRKFLDQLLFDPPSDWTAELMNGDIAVGKLARSAPTSAIAIEREKSVRVIELDRIRCLRFPGVPQYSSPDPRSLSFLALDDGSRFVCQGLKMDETHATVNITSTYSIRAPLSIRRRSFTERIVYWQPANAKVRFLSSDQPLKVVDGSSRSFRKTRLNRASDGGPLMSGGIPYDFGIGTQGPTQVIFPIMSNDKLFRVTAAFNDSHYPIGNVTVRVLLLKDKWLPDVRRFELDAKDKPQSIEVDVSGCRAIGLVTSAGKRGTAGDQVNWLDARIYQQ